MVHFMTKKQVISYFLMALDANTMSEGDHEIKAVSIDSSANSNFDIITVNVVGDTSYTTPPSVTITDPAEGSPIEGITNVNVEATDDDDKGNDANDGDKSNYGNDVKRAR